MLTDDIWDDEEDRAKFSESTQNTVDAMRDWTGRKETLQSCSAQNVIHAPQQDLQSAGDTQAQEPVAWMHDTDTRAVTRSLGGMMSTKGWIPLYTTPQPPVPCPNCLGQEPDDLRLRDEYIKAGREIVRLQAKVAELEKDQSLYCPDCEARASGHSVLVPSGGLKELQAKIAELEEENIQRLETSCQQHVKIMAQTALIEQCEKALLIHRELTRPIGSSEECLGAITAHRGKS